MSCHSDQPVQMGDYLSPNIHTWCTNCGNYGIHGALRRALQVENLHPCQVLLAFDIGCHGNHSDKIDGYRIHGLHGRVLPLASGAAVANRRVKVLAFGGDGGTLAEGINHLITAVRHDYDFTFVLHNNLNYGLTTGQASPTTKPGVAMNSAPNGPVATPLNPIRLVLELGAQFAARTFSGDIHHMTGVFQRAIQHKGFSFVEVLQSCPTYNKSTPHEWYQERVYDIAQMKNYDPTNWEQARATAADLENKIAIGVLYERQDQATFLDRHPSRAGATTELVDEVRPHDVSKLWSAFQ